MERRPGDASTEMATSLRQTYNLTRSEAEVAISLAAGHDMHQIAKMRQVSIGTLRAQLRTIFLKTNTRRQSELVIIILKAFGNTDKTVR